MPLMQTSISAMNVAFSDRNLRKIDPEAFRPGPRNLVGALQSIPGLRLSRAVVEYLEGWPSGLLAAVHGVLHENLTREATVPVTFAWQPAYDYGVTIHDVHDTATSRGGITVVFTSRYPTDTHPLDVAR